MTTAPGSPAAPAVARRSPLYSSVMGLAGLAVLLQGVWAGLFLREGTYDDSWVSVHSVGGMVATALALIGTIIAFVQLRGRRDVQIGSVVFTLLLVLELALGGMISDSHSVGAQAVHIPLALLLMGLAVWLPLRARAGAGDAA